MDPDKIKLENLEKNFEYVRLSNEIDSCDDIEQIKNIAKGFCKLYYKQQETILSIGIPNVN